MTKQVVEFEGVPVGITVPEGNGVRFIAVKFPVIELDGGIYGNVAELQRAIRLHMKSHSNEIYSIAGRRDGSPSSARNAFSAA